MKKIKDLNASIALLQAMLGRNDTQPEQKQNIEAAIKRLKILKKISPAKRPQMFREIREIIERIVKALLK